MGTAWLARIRSSRRRQALSALVGGALALALTTVHWGGLVVGGVAVGLVSRTLIGAVAAGLAFGTAVLVVFLATLGSAGTLGAALGMGQFTVITLVLPLVAGALGALAHGIVPVDGIGSSETRERPTSSASTSGADTEEVAREADGLEGPTDGRTSDGSDGISDRSDEPSDA